MIVRTSSTGNGGHLVLEFLELVGEDLGDEVLAHGKHLDEFDERRAQAGDAVGEINGALKYLFFGEEARGTEEDKSPEIAKQADDEPCECVHHRERAKEEPHSGFLSALAPHTGPRNGAFSFMVVV